MRKSIGPIGQLNSSSKDVKIIGAGISGLVMGHYLKKNGFNISIFEKESRVGGKIGTVQTTYGIAETAANAIFTNDDVINLMDELNLKYISATPNLKKYVWRNNKAISPPFKWFEILRFILGSFKKIDFKDIEKKTIFDFFNPMLGKYFTKEIMSAALGGIYAQPTSVIHFKSVFRSPIKARTYYGFIKGIINQKKSLSKSRGKSISFENGMQDFIDRLKQELNENIFYEDIKTIKKDENIIICTDAFNAYKILSSEVDISNELKKVEYNSMTSSTVITNKQIKYLNKGFGLVIPPEANMESLGILSNTSIFKNRVKSKDTFSYTFLTKNIDRNSNIKDTINTEIQLISNLQPSNIIEIQSNRWDQAIPIYNQNRYDAIIKTRQLFESREKGLVLFGNYIDGISIREIISHAKSFASMSS
jgi:oxygen-dependent protoporphyrinogen oxidase